MTWRVSGKARSARTRAEILDSAWDLIAVRGADASMSEIAEAAGISRQSVHLHFGTRGGLLVALVKRADERLAIRESFFEALAIRSPAERLDACLGVWLDFVPKILPMARDLTRLPAADADAAAAWEDRMADLRSWLHQLVDSLHADGALRPAWTVDDAAAYLWAASSVHVWGLLVSDCGWTDERATRVLREALSTTLLR